MKLVDILAWELKVWPDHMTHLWISAGNTIYGKNGSFEFEMNGGWDKPEDHRTVSVSRAEWQAAVDALNAPKVVEWDGDGLPPVGVDCEVENEVLGGWDHAEKILAHSSINGKDVAVFQRGDLIAYSRAGSFRPTRTAEQVAAEEREKARTEVLNAMTANGKTANEPEAMWKFRLKVVGEMLDMGYRKDTKLCGS